MAKFDLIGMLKRLGRTSPKSRQPQARAGNYTAPVDTAGMDPEMIESLGIRRQRPGMIRQPSQVPNPSQRKRRGY